MAPSSAAMRQAAAAPPAPPPATPEPAAPSGSETQDIDLEQLAEQVYAIIERRLILERESLGL